LTMEDSAILACLQCERNFSQAWQASSPLARLVTPEQVKK
jgi:hypothetical protein